MICYACMREAREQDRHARSAMFPIQFVTWLMQCPNGHDLCLEGYALEPHECGDAVDLANKTIRKLGK